jgi:hypothetical protein
MALTALAKKLFRTLARVIPQFGMIAQAVAFNMFLAFFAVLLIALSLMKGSLEGENGQQVAMRLSAILPPDSWQLISAFVLRQEVNTWYLALAGWVGTLLVGSQVIKLITKGIEMIYGGHHTHLHPRPTDSWRASVFLGKRGMAPRLAAECVWWAMGPIDGCRIRRLFLAPYFLGRPASVTGDDPGHVRPGLDLSRGDAR